MTEPAPVSTALAALIAELREQIKFYTTKSHSVEWVKIDVAGLTQLLDAADQLDTATAALQGMTAERDEAIAVCDAQRIRAEYAEAAAKAAPVSQERDAPPTPGDAP